MQQDVEQEIYRKRLIGFVMHCGGLNGKQAIAYVDATIERHDAKLKLKNQEIAMSNETDLDWLAQDFKPFISIEDNQEQEMKQDNGWFERGELPPVGVDCIFEPGIGSCFFNEYELKASGKIVKIIAHTRYEQSSSDVAVFRWDIDDCFGVSTGSAQAFRPIRTERELAIDEMMKVAATNWGNLEDCCDALYRAGFRKESK